MANDNTIADAQGNVAAQIYTQIIESPDDTPFETQVTPEMIEKHKYYNDDILQIAEEMKKILSKPFLLKLSYSPTLGQISG